MEYCYYYCICCCETLTPAAWLVDVVETYLRSSARCRSSRCCNSASRARSEAVTPAATPETY